MTRVTPNPPDPLNRFLAMPGSQRWVNDEGYVSDGTEWVRAPELDGKSPGCKARQQLDGVWGHCWCIRDRDHEGPHRCCGGADEEEHVWSTARVTPTPVRPLGAGIEPPPVG